MLSHSNTLEGQITKGKKGKIVHTEWKSHFWEEESRVFVEN